MRSSKDHLRNIDRSAEQSADHLSDIKSDLRQSAASNARSAAQNTQHLKSIAFNSRASMVFNGITAANTARQAKTQKEQLALQREQHALQQTMAEQTARHEFSMWRQTEEGTAFVEWQQRAAALVPLLRNRERTWHAAWANAIERSQSETPPDERQRLASYPERLKQTGFKVASILSFAVAGLVALILLFQLVTSSFSESVSQANNSNSDFTYEECLERLNDPDNFIFNESDCEAINPNPAGSNGPVIFSSVALVLLIGLGITFVVLRKVKQREALADPTVQNETAARVAKWGFDPFTTRGAWYAWHESQDFTGYADHIEHMVHTGPSQRPQPSQLIPLQVPTPWTPDDRLPTEVNNVLDSFQQENEELSR